MYRAACHLTVVTLLLASCPTARPPQIDASWTCRTNEAVKTRKADDPAAPSAQLDSSTPATQGGYTLLAVQRADKNAKCVLRLGAGKEYTNWIVGEGSEGTAFWIRAP